MHAIRRVIVLGFGALALGTAACGGSTECSTTCGDIVVPRSGGPYFRVYENAELVETQAPAASTALGSLQVAARFPSSGDVVFGINISFGAIPRPGDVKVCRTAPSGAFTIGPNEAIVDYRIDGPTLSAQPVSGCTVTILASDGERVRASFAFQTSKQAVHGEFDLDVPPTR